MNPSIPLTHVLAASLLVVAAGVVTTTARSRGVDLDPQEPSSSCTEVTTGGISIFDETMVDMSWVEVEEAAAEDAMAEAIRAALNDADGHRGH